MTTLVMRGGDPHVLLSHLALYGLGAILEDAGVEVRLGWIPPIRALPQVSAPDADEDTIAGTVLEHARRLATLDSWLSADVELKGTARGLMSPRLTPFGDDDATWARVQQARHGVLDELTHAGRWLDLRQAAALGEPAYWSHNRKDEVLQDDGASRLEMQPRNQGSEIVGNRLRKLATAVADRDAGQVLAGLQGLAVRDEIGKDKVDSRTATGLANPGPTDNALAWCALWGISQLPIAMRVGSRRASGTAVTTGHLGRTRTEWFYAPIWDQDWRPARLRSVLASARMRTAAAAGLPLGNRAVSEVDAIAARAWLSARHVTGLIRFPIERFGSDSAPERRAMRGEPLPVLPGQGRSRGGPP